MKKRRTKRSHPSSYYEYDERNYRRSRLLVLFIFCLMVLSVVCFFYVSFVIRNISNAYEPMVEVASDSELVGRDVQEVMRGRQPISLLWLGVDDSESGRLVSEQVSLIALTLLQAGDESGDLVQIASESQNDMTNRLPTGPLSQSFLMKPLQSVQETAHQLLNIPIDYTIEVRFSKLRPLIDRLGGLKLVPKQDFTLENRLFPAQQAVTLSGREVYLYLARQANEGSLSHGQRQLDVMEALINQLSYWQKVPQLDQDIELLREAIRTNLSFDAFLDLFKAGYFNHMTQASSDRLQLEAGQTTPFLEELKQKLETK